MSLDKSKIVKLSLPELEEMNTIFNGTPEPLRKVLDAVSEYESKGKYEYMAICPCHDDSNPSLQITWEPISCKVLLCCFGCKANFKALVSALGLGEKDLFMTRKYGTKRIVETYDYCDEQGTVLYQKLRYEPKSFSQQKPDGNGGWTSKLNGVRRVLYNLVELLEATTPVVYILEGEKDVETLKALGYVATTSGGTGTWKSEFSQYLRGRHVIIIPDDDEPGELYANQIINDLLGKATDIKVVKLPHGKDITDYFSCGGTEDVLRMIVAKAPLITKVPAQVYNNGPTTLHCDEIEPEDVSWLWQDRVALGELTMLAGAVGIGKSLWTLYIAARVSTGTVWPDDRGAPDAGSSYIFTSEDRAKNAIVPRLILAGADLSKVDVVVNAFDIDEIIRHMTRELKIRNDIKLIILDPITGYLGKTDSHKNAEVRRTLTPLCSFADRHNIAILAVTHYAKAQSSSVDNKVIGSMAFNAIARQVWHVIDDGKQLLFVQGKKNNTSVQPGLSFAIEKLEYELKTGKKLTNVRINISPQAVHETAQEVDDRLNRKPMKTNIAEDFFEQVLADGPKEKQVIEKLAAEQEIKEHTLRRARVSLGIRTTYEGIGKDRKTLWNLR